MTGLSDSLQRPISYLRVSVTDRCNLSCRYCFPEERCSFLPREELLTYEEIAQVVQVATGLGVNKVRLTGGEPLVRHDLVELVAMLSTIPGVDDLSLTTNGLLLSRYALPLKRAGLRRVNISLDTLRPERFRSITGAPGLERVLAGIRRAQQVGLVPVKINMVVMRGVNDDEIEAFARRSLRGWNVRFIELMPFGRSRDGEFLPIGDIARRVEALGRLEPVFTRDGAGPAKYFRLPGARGTVGFIGAVTDCFCSGCNRLRLTAEGRLRPCLFGEEGVDLKEPLRSGASLEELRETIARAAQLKPEGHRLAQGIGPADPRMSRIGG